MYMIEGAQVLSSDLGVSRARWRGGAGVIYYAKEVQAIMAKGKYHEWLEPDGLLRLEAWARDGLTDEQIAHNCGVTSETLRQWKKRFPSIFGALKKGKEVVDIEVENALLKSGIGYPYDEITQELVQVGVDDDGVPIREMQETKRVTKWMPPNVGALIFWLKNRKPDKWRDKPMDNTAATELLEKAKEMLDGVPSGF